MCGIIAVVRRPSTRPTPSTQSVLDLVVDQAAGLGSGAGDITGAFAAVGERLAQADALLRGVPGLRLMLAEPTLGPTLIHHCDEILAAVEQEERRLEQDAGLATSELEARNQALIGVRDGRGPVDAFGQHKEWEPAPDFVARWDENPGQCCARNGSADPEPKRDRPVPEITPAVTNFGPQLVQRSIKPFR